MIDARLTSGRRIAIALLFCLLLILFVCIATDRITHPDHPDGDYWFTGFDPGYSGILSYIRVNEHGWPLTTISRYRQRWNGGVNVVTDEWKGKLRKKVRDDAYRARSADEWDRYKEITNEFPEESGVRFHWPGFIINPIAALLATISIVIAAD